MARAFSLTTILFLVWMLWSGIFTPMLLTFGVISCVFVVFLAMRMKIVDSETHPVFLVPGFLAHLPWLMVQIITSNLQVAMRITRGLSTISPTLLEVPATQKTDIGHVIFANSITITPGTISIKVRPGSILVHALSTQGANDLLGGEMDRRVTRIEGGFSGARDDV